MRLSRALALVVLVGATLTALPAHAAAPSSAGRFIVTLKDSADARAVAAEYHRRDGVEVSYVYEDVMNGFAGAVSQSALGRLQADGRVARLERDGVAKASAVTSWGLDRIDQEYLALDQTFNANGTGSGVEAYVIDTGIYGSHDEFTNRIGNGFDAVGDGNGTSDCNGHGTHVAGTIGGETYGIATQVRLHPVRVLNCAGSGTWSGVIAGMDWVYGQVADSTGAATFPAVANMSLGGGLSSSVNTSAARLATVVTLGVAAGNDNRDATNYSPASAANVVTVGATTSTDARASYSNYGDKVEIFAPGSSITSAWIGGTSASNTISGTSMATPHVVGVAATLASTRTVSQVKNLLTSSATPGVVSNSLSANNLLLFNGSTAGHAPSMTLTGSCTSSSCAYTATGRDADGDHMTFAWSTNVSAQAESTTVLGKTTATASSSASNRTVTVTGTAGGQSIAKSVTVSCSKKGSRTTCSVR